MTHTVDLYYTMRSPYCYLATPVLVALVQKYDLFFRIKPVYPLALSQPDFFEKTNPMWISYVAKDTQRIARRLGIPFGRSRPDPIVQDIETRRISSEQPYIYRLTRLAQLAAEQNKGLDYVASVGALIRNPEIDGWDQGDYLAKAIARANLDPVAMEATAVAEAERLDQAIERNRQEQLAAGHWGAPLFVYEGEAFFGQDRIDDLIWHLQERGLREL